MFMSRGMYIQDIASLGLCIKVCYAHFTRGQLHDVDITAAWFVIMMTIISIFVELPKLSMEVYVEYNQPFKPEQYTVTKEEVESSIPGWVRTVSPDGVVTMTKVDDEETQEKTQEETQEETQETKEDDTPKNIVEEATEFIASRTD